MINSLIQAWSDWLTPLISNVASHLRRHWSQSEHILTGYLSEVSLASKGCDWQLKGSTGGLWNLLSVIGLVIVGSGCHRLEKWSQETWLCKAETRSGLTTSCHSDFADKA